MNPDARSNYPLSTTAQWLLCLSSLCIVAFGQPAWGIGTGFLAATLGYALFFRVLPCYALPKQRFWLGMAWFTAVQLVQLSWFVSHPYYYIYAVYLFLSLGLGIQFGCLSLFITPRALQSYLGSVSISALWVVCEWLRLFVLSGFSWNPSGLAFGDNRYAMQMATLFGVFGLSFWVMWTNLLLIKAWTSARRFAPWAVWLAAAALPYLFGAWHLQVHQREMARHREDPSRHFKALLVQTAFPIEESIDFNTKKNMIRYVTDEWRKILEITKKHEGQQVDLIALPEFVVPFGTYTYVYPLSEVLEIFESTFGVDSLQTLPLPEAPLGTKQKTMQGTQVVVNNAFWAQALANHFNTNVIAGLEDAEHSPVTNERQYFSSAMFFRPLSHEAQQEAYASAAIPERYEKRVLVPMGEYIPFTFCKELAAQYGVFGSFTCGTEAKTMDCGKALISPSICYEETFSHIMHESKQKGADVFINLTSDVWYPNSRLARQHFDHSRLRTVENGMPLLRACNTGITGAVDSLGNVVCLLGGDDPEAHEWTADALFASVPLYSYDTLYSAFGDKLIIGFSLIAVLIGLQWGGLRFWES